MFKTLDKLMETTNKINELLNEVEESTNAIVTEKAKLIEKMKPIVFAEAEELFEYCRKFGFDNIMIELDAYSGILFRYSKNYYHKGEKGILGFSKRNSCCDYICGFSKGGNKENWNDPKYIGWKNNVHNEDKEFEVICNLCENWSAYKDEITTKLETFIKEKLKRKQEELSKMFTREAESLSNIQSELNQSIVDSYNFL